MKWKVSPRIKIYEALGTIADKRIQIKGNTAQVVSSRGDKTYTVTYDPKESAITSNDNGSYWQGYLGYPAIAFLLQKKIISYNKQAAELLKDIPWKDINDQFKNNFDKTEVHILELLKKEELMILIPEVKNIAQQLEKLDINKLPSILKPPLG